MRHFFSFDELLGTMIDVLDNPYASATIQLQRDKDKLKYELEIPGTKKEDIKISYENNYLYVSAKNRKGTKINRSIFVNSDKYDYEQANVKYVDGLLTIEIPKRKTISPTKKFLEIK